MTRKLYAFAKGECAAEISDNPMFQELLLGGQLYGMILKVRLWSCFKIISVNSVFSHHPQNQHVQAKMKYSFVSLNLTDSTKMQGR
jgi:hypothetical protein